MYKLTCPVIVVGLVLIFHVLFLFAALFVLVVDFLVIFVSCALSILVVGLGVFSC